MNLVRTLLVCALVALAGPTLAEGGGDRLMERIDARHSTSVSG